MNRGRGLTNRLGIELKDAVITPLLNNGRLEKKKDDHLSVAGDSYLVIRVTGSDPSRPTTIEIDNLKVEEIK